MKTQVSHMKIYSIFVHETDYFMLVLIFTLQSQQSRLLCHMLWSLRGHNVGRVLTDQPGSDEVFARASYEAEALPCL